MEFSPIKKLYLNATFTHCARNFQRILHEVTHFKLYCNYTGILAFIVFFEALIL